MLDLTVTGAVSRPRCAATARLMQGVPPISTRVRLHDADGRRSASCAVPRTVEGHRISAAFLSTDRSQDSAAAGGADDRRHRCGARARPRPGKERSARP